MEGGVGERELAMVGAMVFGGREAGGLIPRLVLCKGDFRLQLSSAICLLGNSSTKAWRYTINKESTSAGDTLQYFIYYTYIVCTILTLLNCIPRLRR